jgi:hypothetical protein
MARSLVFREYFMNSVLIIAWEPPHFRRPHLALMLRIKAHSECITREFPPHHFTLSSSLRLNWLNGLEAIKSDRYSAGLNKLRNEISR